MVGRQPRPAKFQAPASMSGAPADPHDSGTDTSPMSVSGRPPIGDLAVGRRPATPPLGATQVAGGTGTWRLSCCARAGMVEQAPHGGRSRRARRGEPSARWSCRRSRPRSACGSAGLAGQADGGDLSADFAENVVVVDVQKAGDAGVPPPCTSSAPPFLGAQHLPVTVPSRSIRSGRGAPPRRAQVARRKCSPQRGMDHARG